MSSIPNTAMKHAHVHEDEETADSPAIGAALGERARELGDYAQELAEDALDAVKARPKTAAAIGAAIVAGAAAIAAAPAAVRALKGDDAKKPAPKKKAAKKG